MESKSRARSRSPSSDALDPAAPEADDDDEDEISLVKTMTLALTLQGVGDWVTQIYTISAYFVALSLLTFNSLIYKRLKVLESFEAPNTPSNCVSLELSPTELNLSMVRFIVYKLARKRKCDRSYFD